MPINLGKMNANSEIIDSKKFIETLNSEVKR